MKDEKDVYEPPRAMRLTALDGGAGFCEQGNSDAEYCYVPGNTAGGDCDSDGGSATGQCWANGNTANVCYYTGGDTS